MYFIYCELTSIRRVYPHLKAVDLLIHSLALPTPVDTGHKLNVHKTFRRRPGRLLNVLCTFSLCPVSTISGEVCFIFTPQWNWETSFKNWSHLWKYSMDKNLLSPIWFMWLLYFPFFLWLFFHQTSPVDLGTKSLERKH